MTTKPAKTAYVTSIATQDDTHIAEPQSADERLRSILELSTDWYWEQDQNFRFTRVAGAAFEATGINPQEYLGTWRWDHGAVPVGEDGNWDQHKTLLNAHQPFSDFLYWLVDAQGELRYISSSGQPMFDPQQRFLGYRGIARDMTASKRQEQLLRLEHIVARCLADADDLPSALVTVMRSVCETQKWACARYFSLDEATQMLRMQAFWHIPNKKLEGFVAKSRDVEYASNNSLSSRISAAWQAKQPMWVPDISKDKRGRKGIARQAGMRGAFFFPINLEGKTIGVVSFHGYEIREPDARLLQAVRVIGDQIGQFVRRKRTEEALRVSNERFRLAARSTKDIIWDWDLLSGDHWRNENAASVFGYREDEAGQRVEFWHGCIHPEDRERVVGGMQALIDSSEDSWNEEYQFRRRDGSYAHVLDRGTVIRDTSGRAIRMIGAMHDITARREDEKRIQYLATHDGLTDLPNRTFFNQILNHTIENARRFNRELAVMFIDLDRFKSINDTLGHGAGDQLLQEIAKRLTSCLRRADVVARLGGDEFVVLVQEVSENEQVSAVAQKIINSVMKPVDISGQECWVTASIGICMYPADAQDEQSLMKNADIAMYLAKNEGKNNFQFYSHSVQVQSLERMTMESSLRKALQRGEFRLHYQAKLDLKSNRVTGVEALLRWEHPDLGLVPPAHFIPLAEETGLIVPIGKWVLETACAQNVTWQQAGMPAVHMAVNLSARQFADHNLLEDIIATLKNTGMRPQLLELELTESMIMHRPEEATKLLTDIKKLGVRIAIDDFGVGYSSLAQIKRFPIDILKVDRSFIRDLTENVEDQAITDAIIAMGKTLSLTVVAEGVETLEQQSFLVDHACDEMQGFYFSKPLEPDQFINFFREHAADSQ